MKTNLTTRLVLLVALLAGSFTLSTAYGDQKKGGRGNLTPTIQKSGGQGLGTSLGGLSGNFQNKGTPARVTENTPKFTTMPGRIVDLGKGAGGGGTNLGNGIIPKLEKPNFGGRGTTLGDVKPTLPIVGNLGGGKQTKPADLGKHNLGKFDINKISNTRLDFGKGGIKVDPSNKTTYPKFGNNNKCIKPWNPWCDSYHPWYPCGIFHDHCHPCWHWNPCVQIIYCDCLPVYVCDPLYHYVPVVVAAEVARCDLELVDVRLVDHGIPQSNLGPCYRVMVRNSSSVSVSGEFQVTLLATQGGEATAETPRGQGTLNGLAAGQTAIVDVRLPESMVKVGAGGLTFGYNRLIGVVDSRRQVSEVNESNNAAAFDRVNVASVNPLVMGFEQQAAGELMVLGNGFGEKSGEAFIAVGGVKLKLDVVGWSGQALKVKMPEVSFGKEAKAELIVIRPDGEASKPAELPTPDAV